jgi:protein-S-isoprenylcysteine O-methyltransferase Ste14
MLIINSVLTGALVTSLLVQALAAKTMFVAPHGVPPATRFLATCFVICGLIQGMVVSRVPISWGGLGIGCLLYACGLALFFATCSANSQRRLSVAFSQDRPEHLVLWGPYRYIRHPYYASYCLTWLAGVAATCNLLAAATFVIMLVLYVCAARSEERKFLKSAYSALYEQYRHSTGMLVPHLGSSRRALVFGQDGSIS